MQRGNSDAVHASKLEWLPGGSEFPDETGVHFSQAQALELDARPVAGCGDILLCRLAPRQVIELEAHAVVGVGGDHAKFSPVGTAWHRLYPEVAVKTVRAALLRCHEPVASQIRRNFTVLCTSCSLVR